MSVTLASRTSSRAPARRSSMPGTGRSLGGAGESRDALEQQSGADAALEHVAAGAVALDQLDLEIVDQGVVAVGPVGAALGLVAVRESS